MVTTLIPTEALNIVSATLIDAWSDLHGLFAGDAIRAEAESFVQSWERGYRLRAEYQLAVSRLTNFLQELSRWLGQAEALSIRDPSSAFSENELFAYVWPPLRAKLSELFERFELAVPIGISEADLPFIFDRFRQADGSESRRFSGLGIGLALAKELAQKHGGALTVESRLGEGSTFTLRLPARDAPITAEESSNSENSLRELLVSGDLLNEIYRSADRFVAVEEIAPAEAAPVQKNAARCG